MPASVHPAPDRPPTTWEARRVRASGTTILLAAITVVVVYLARELFVAALQPIGWVAAAGATALVIAPLVSLPDRILPRGIAALVTLAVGAAIVATVGVALVMEVRDQLTELEEVVPAAAAEIEEGNEVLVDLGFATLVQDLVDQTSQRISPDPTVDDAAGTVPAFFVSGVLVVFIVLWAGRMFQGLQRQISDERRRRALAAVVPRIVTTAQRYLLTSAAVAAAVGVAAGVGAWAADLPTPLVLGVLVGAASVVPYFGILLGGLPALVLAGAFEPATTTVLVGAAVIVLQAAHTVAMRRIVEPGSLRVGPAVIVIAAFVGSDLYGVGGALVALVAGVVAVATVDALGDDPATT